MQSPIRAPDETRLRLPSKTRVVAGVLASADCGVMSGGEVFVDGGPTQV